MHAGIVVVGNELLSGHTADANGPWLAERLRAMGHELNEIMVVPDVHERIVEAIARQASANELVFVCGGLGPTTDDITIEAVASFLGCELVVADEARTQVQRIYKQAHDRGLLEAPDVDEAAWRMARVPEPATVVPNDVGVAPGSVVSVGEDRVLVVLPGPPRELQSVFGHVEAEGLLPKGEPTYETELHVRSFEAPIADRLNELVERFPDVRMGSYPQHGEVRVIVRLTGARASVERAADALREAVADLIIEESEDT